MLCLSLGDDIQDNTEVNLSKNIYAVCVSVAFILLRSIINKIKGKIKKRMILY